MLNVSRISTFLKAVFNFTLVAQSAWWWAIFLLNRFVNWIIIYSNGVIMIILVLMLICYLLQIKHKLGLKILIRALLNRLLRRPIREHSSQLILRLIRYSF